MKFKLHEDLFDDVVVMEVPEAEAPIVVSDTQRGPETPQEVGESSLILNAISDCANNIDNPNAESIMNGAVEAEEQVVQDVPNIQLESLNEDRWDPFDPDRWTQDMTELKDRISYSIYTMAKKHRDLTSLKAIRDVATDCRNTFINCLNYINSVYDSIEDQSTYKESLKESKLNEEAGDGWSEDIKYQLEEVLERAYNLQYEVNNCVRGAYTHCETTDELGEYVKQLGEDFVLIGEDLPNYPAYDEIGESLNEDQRESILNEGDWEDPERRKYYGVDDDSFYDPFELEPQKTFDNDYDDDWDFDESLNEDRLPFESLKKKNEGFKPLQVTSSDYNNDSNKNNIMEDIANEQVNIEDVDDEF